MTIAVLILLVFLGLLILTGVHAWLERPRPIEDPRVVERASVEFFADARRKGWEIEP